MAFRAVARNPFIALALVATLVAGQADGAEQFSREVKLAKGKAKVEVTPGSPETKASRINHPRLGIAPSPSASFGNFLARAFDESGKVDITPPSRLQGVFRTLGAGFEQLMRSELTEAVNDACRTGHLDYLLVMGAPQMSMKTDVTAFIVGLGRMRMRNRQESRLYECRSRKTVWAASVMFETSQGTMSSALTGNSAGALLGGPEAEQAMAKIYGDKLAGDMGW